VDVSAVLAITAGVTAAAVLAVWLVSLVLRNASIADIFWGPGFVLIAATAFAAGEGGDPARRALVLALTAAWGLRLGGYLLWRNSGHGEDPRYQAMRRHYGSRFPLVSLATVFLFQGALMWFVSLPVQVAMVSPAPVGALDAIGTLLFAIGLGFESVGDLQLARFKADPANAGRVMDRGLWRYTRHPNYFGDSLAWWGLFAIALATPAGVFTVLSPVLMTFLLLRVSGIALLERSIGKRRPDYADYQARTSAFVPLPPRRASER
jgi:steroid 5-alpha reductase family enzyme